jgi:serine/threonine-protein kinase
VDEAETEAPDPLLGTILEGRYRIDAFVARGGMGRVYRAHQLGLGRDVAIKVLDVAGQVGNASIFRKRFFAEAGAMAALSHANTVRVYDYGTLPDGSPFLAMEFLVGRTVEEALEEGEMSVAALIDAVQQACDSLAEAHAAGFVHRDIKPSNLFLVPRPDGSEQVKVVDFGLVKQTDGELRLTRSGTLLGSPLYMSPEQVTGEDVDARADVYALGALLFHGLTGQPPFDGHTLGAVLLAHASQPPPHLDEVVPERKLPKSLDLVVQTCLAKKREERFSGVLELSRALALCEAELSGQTGPLLLRIDEGQVVTPPGVSVSLSSRGARVTMAGPLPGATATIERPPGPTAARPGRRAGLLVGALLVAAVGLALVVGGAAVAWRLWAVPSAAPVEVALAVIPTTATISREGAFVGQGEARVPVAPGERVLVEVSAPLYFPQTLELDGSVDAIELKLVLDTEQVPPPEPKIVEPAPTTRPRPAAPDPAPRVIAPRTPRTTPDPNPDKVRPTPGPAPRRRPER